MQDAAIESQPLLVPWKGNPTSMSTTSSSLSSSAVAVSPVCIPSRRRHIHSELKSHGGRPLVASLQQQDDDGGHQQRQKNDHKEGTVVGISMAGWDIRTSQGPIGDSQWFENALLELEPLSQPCRSSFLNQKNISDSGNSKTQTTNARRQLVLPEMVFPNAYVVLDYRCDHTSRREGEVDEAAEEQQVIKEDPHRLILSWNAKDFLLEWAMAHQAIPLPVHQTILTGDDDDGDDHHGETTNEDGGTVHQTIVSSSRGVSVLETFDASLWKTNKKGATATTTAGEAERSPEISSTTFHYDWTFSSPYCGNLQLLHLPPSATSAENKRQPEWKVLETSAMPMHLLTDRTVPILFFDELVLVEDDLHDNGQMQFTVKLRVMPTCVYVLAQLFVRVDHVLLRLRETRWMVEFSQKEEPTTTSSSSYSSKTIKIYRDVTWRECAWEALGAHRLSNNVKTWTQNEYQQPQEAASFAQLLQRLPLVPLSASSLLPHEIPAHAVLELQIT